MFVEHGVLPQAFCLNLRQRALLELFDFVFVEPELFFLLWQPVLFEPFCLFASSDGQQSFRKLTSGVCCLAGTSMVSTVFKQDFKIMKHPGFKFSRIMI